MKTIFDQLGIPASERTYSLSLYEHRRCAPATRPGPSYACTDEDAHDWADQSLRRVRETVGPEPRLFAAEFGALPPTDPSWSTEVAAESLSVLMQRYRVDGGAYWLWVNGNDADEGNPQLAEPVKRRGAAFAYNPVRLQVLDMYGFHLASIPNGSFENDRSRHRRLARWTIAGKGTGALRSFAGDRTRPWRGRLFIGLVSRSGISVTSALIRVSPDTAYTTTGDFGTRGTRSSVAFRYLTCTRHPSAVQADSRFPLASSSAFTTVPLRYKTPADACFVRIEILARHSEVDADNLH